MKFSALSILLGLAQASSHTVVQKGKIPAHGIFADIGRKNNQKSEEFPDRKTLKSDSFYSGYLPIDVSDQDAFYALFESRGDVSAKDNHEDPLFIWLRGEPGCSPTSFLFDKGGPYLFESDDKSNVDSSTQDRLISNDLSWNNFTNLMVVDLPVGVGYSFSRNAAKRDKTLNQFVTDFVHFMKQFYEKHPQFTERELYLGGLDFTAGQYMPFLAQAIHELKLDKFEDSEYDEKFFPTKTEVRWQDKFNLKGVMLGNPVLDETTQRFNSRKFAEQKNLTTQVTDFFMGFYAKWCKDLSTQPLWLQTAICGFSDSIAVGNPIYPLFDIRNVDQKCQSWFTCESANEMGVKLMNEYDITELFGAQTKSESIWGDWKWQECDSWEQYHWRNLYRQADEHQIYQESNIHYLQEMLNRHMKVLIMQGDLDYQMNYFGTEQVIKDLDWYGKEDLQAKMSEDQIELEQWSYQNQAGKQVNGGFKAALDNFTYLRVKDAGLKIYQEKPELMYSTLKDWIQAPMRD